MSSSRYSSATDCSTVVREARRPSQAQPAAVAAAAATRRSPQLEAAAAAPGLRSLGTSAGPLSWPTAVALAQDLALNDAVGHPGDSLAVELGDKLVEPVMDWDRVGTEGQAQIAVVAPVVAQACRGRSTAEGADGGVGAAERGCWRASHWSRAVWAAVRRAW